MFQSKILFLVLSKFLLPNDKFPGAGNCDGNIETFIAIEYSYWALIHAAVHTCTLK